MSRKVVIASSSNQAYLVVAKCNYNNNYLTDL